MEPQSSFSTPDEDNVISPEAQEELLNGPGGEIDFFFSVSKSTLKHYRFFASEPGKIFLSNLEMTLKHSNSSEQHWVIKFTY